MPSTVFRWSMIACITSLLVLVPFVYYRSQYSHAKRLRVVVPGKVYRSGCLTANGFREAIERFGIRTVLNLQEEAQDPNLPNHYWGGGSIRESELCRQMGVNYRFLQVELVPRDQVPAKRPATIEKFLEVMDDPANYPVLIHCKAGLHRTGCLSALYRLEYDRWSIDQAMDELKGHGFGDRMATSFNDYIVQYILAYRPGLRVLETAGGAGR